MNRKSSLGFDTHAKRLQEKFEEIRRVLGTKKARWEKAKELAIKYRTESDEMYEQLVGSPEVMKYPKEIAELLKTADEYAQFWTLMEIIAFLGIDVSETHERLSKVEKAVAELRLRSK